MQKLNVYGDSHARFFKISPELSGFQASNLTDFEVDVTLFIGSTILGLPRRESTLSVNLSISDTVAGSIAVFNFGQVDVELGYFYRTVVKGETVTFDEFSDRLVESYRTFLEGITDTASSIVVKGINPPVLVSQGKAIKYIARIISEKEDEARHAEQFERLREILPPIEERTAMSKTFNTAIESMCAEIGVGYFDLWKMLLNKKAGRIHDRHVPSVRDHHLVDSVWIRRQHWKKLLKTIAKHRPGS